MRRMQPLLPVLVVGLLVGGTATAEGDPAPSSDSVAQLAQRLGAPARAEAVEAVYRSLSRADPAPSIRFAAALAHSGGPEAGRGIVRLLKSRHGSVRVAALEAAAKLRARSPLVLARVRYATMDDDPAVIVAVCKTLGAIGDGGDVPTLLLLARSEDKRTRVAAYRALRELSGVRIPYVYARWSWWWRTRSERAQREVLIAIRALEHPDLTAAAATEHEALIRREAWIVLPTLRPQISAWLVGSSIDRRILACRLAGDLGLVDLLETIRPLVRFGFRADLKQAAAEAVRVLSGQPAPPVSKPTDTDDR